MAAGDAPAVEGSGELSEATLDALRKKASAGDVEVQFKLGQMFAKGDVVKQDYDEAVRWLSTASDQEHLEALTLLGMMYLHGKGVSQSYEKAVKYLGKAAVKGKASAQFWLGMMYERGDEDERAKWFRLAAEQGFPLAQFYLGTMYVTGAGAPQDYIEGYKWLTLAAAQGSGNSQAMLEMAGALMSPQQVNEAKRRAESFAPKQ